VSAAWNCRLPSVCSLTWQAEQHLRQCVLQQQAPIPVPVPHLCLYLPALPPHTRRPVFPTHAVQEQKAKKAARQAKREPQQLTRYPSSTPQTYQAHVSTPAHEVNSYASHTSSHMGSPGYYSPVHPSGEARVMS
jgi:hypothetical protein